MSKEKDSEQIIPNEILSAIQNQADWNIARNMAQTSSHLRGEFNKREMKKCRDFIQFIFSYHLFNPTQNHSNHYNVPTKSLDELINKYSTSLCSDMGRLVKQMKRFDKELQEMTPYEKYVARNSLRSSFIEYVPFTFGEDDFDYMEIFKNFIRGKDYRVIVRKR